MDDPRPARPRQGPRRHRGNRRARVHPSLPVWHSALRPDHAGGHRGPGAHTQRGRGPRAATERLHRARRQRGEPTERPEQQAHEVHRRKLERGRSGDVDPRGADVAHHPVRHVAPAQAHQNLRAVATAVLEHRGRYQPMARGAHAGNHLTADAGARTRDGGGTRRAQDARAGG